MKKTFSLQEELMKEIAKELTFEEQKKRMDNIRAAEA